jgi:hypothetical protein
MDCRAYASPKGLRPRRRVKPGNDGARHCEERSDEAIQLFGAWPLDCFASLAMTVTIAHLERDEFRLKRLFLTSPLRGEVSGAS